MIQRLRSTLLAIALIFLGGCATELSDITHRYDGSIAVRTSKTVRIQVSTIEPSGGIEKESTMVSANGILVPVLTGRSFDPRFGREDQLKAAQYLGEELVRTGAVKSIAASPTPVPEDMQVTLEFTSTEFRKITRSYLIRLKVTMIEGGRKVDRDYLIDSSERDNSAETWNSTAGRHKIKANKLIIERVIQDLQKFVTSA